MSSEIILRDQNHVTVAAGVSNDASQDVLMFRVDPVTNYLLVVVTDTGATAGISAQIAKRDENYRTVCLAYNEQADELQEVLTDSQGNLLCDLLLT